MDRVDIDGILSLYPISENPEWVDMIPPEHKG